MNLESGSFNTKESFPSKPFAVRGHHIGDIAKIVTRYPSASLQAVDSENRIVQLADLYKYPGEGKKYLAELTADQVNLMLGSYSDGFDLGFFYDDYLGKDGARARQFQARKTVFYNQIFLSDPDTSIEINTSPDAICRGCQSTPSNMPGRHCLQFIQEDADYVQIVSELLGSQSSDATGQKAKISLAASKLRDESFMQQVVQKRREVSYTFEQLVNDIEELSDE